MSNVESSFLGTGWSFPPTFSRSTGSVVMASAELDIKESLWVLFSTALRERVMLPEYGSGIWRMVFRSITTSLTTQLQQQVRDAILFWEPRIDVVKVEVSTEASVKGVVKISVDYIVRQTNARNNLVFPFYIEEGTIPVEGP